MNIKSPRPWFSLLLGLTVALSLVPGNPAAASGEQAQQAKLKVDSRLSHDLPLPAGKVPGIQAKTATGPVNSEPHNFVPESDSDAITTVIVELKNTPVDVFENQVSSIGKSVQASKVRTEHSKFKSAAEAALSVQFKREYTRAFNGYSLEIPANQVNRLLKLPGVKAVYPNLEYHALPIETSGEVTAQLDKSVPHMGSPEFWEAGYKGKGIKVGVIDTGVDYNHPSIKDAFKGGYDFVDNDKDPFETRPNPNFPPKNGKPYETSHGTHVSGTIVGRGNPDQPGSTGWARGVAPEADLYVYRVLGPYGSGSSENVIAAIEESVADGLDVINLSLGADYNNQYTADTVALDNAVKAGVEVVVANGNDGPGDATVGSPGGSQLAISVGASTPPMDIPIFNSAEHSGLRAQLATFSPDLTPSEQGWDIVDAGLGKAADYNGVDVKGKLALVSRGEISFQEKAINATAAGATGLIIYNNEAGEIAATLNEPGDYAPTYTITQTDGQALKRDIASGQGHVTIGSLHEEDYMADFSSRGPALPDYTIKPDLSAPGVNITSTVPAWDGNYEEAYASMQGTSMASPHVAGAVALVLERSKSERKENHLTPNQIKALLTNNSVVLNDRNGQPYSAQVQGAGRIDLGNVLEATAIASVEETLPIELDHGASSDYKTGSFSFGQVAPGTSVTKTLDLDNLTGDAQAYDVHVDWQAAGEAAPSLTAESSSLSLTAGQRAASLGVTLEVPKTASDGYYEGRITLTDRQTGHQLTLPAGVYVGESYTIGAVTDLSVTPDIFSPNQDGLYDTADLSFTVNRPLKDFSLVAEDASGKIAGTIYDGLAHQPEHRPDIYQLSAWDGKVQTDKDVKPLNDGLYWLTPSIHDSEELLSDESVPFVLDREAPEAALDEPNVKVDEKNPGKGIISGQIVRDTLLEVLPVSYSDAIGVAVLSTGGDGQSAQYDGVIDENGRFTVEVPLTDGENNFEIYVYDAAYNGLLEPFKTITYNGETPEQPVEGTLSLDSEDYSITLNDTFDVAVFFTDKEGKVRNVTKEASFESADPSIVSVDSEGNLTGLKPGTTSIKVTYQGISTSATVWVVRPYAPKTPAQEEPSTAPKVKDEVKAKVPADQTEADPAPNSEEKAPAETDGNSNAGQAAPSKDQKQDKQN
ncbi:S8 family serine peptidase [Paenibacillus sp. CAA11]|uniref:S8 family serine peptidase n=1 Tax=Paenibacillus sp. CAA11 TaxID=1532905 RepID=UPI00131F1EF9|nr:S8 family serine peptidase [Paenibacillus sp. CAA11]